MSQTTGIKGAGVDVAKRLQRAAEAIVTPKRLGTEGLEAFKTLRVLDNLASLLPPQWQGITKALIGLGISNVGQHAEPQAKDAVRGYTSALAIKSGRVPADVIAQAAGPQQKQALIDASANGDLATVKSILRHNKKEAARTGGGETQKPLRANDPRHHDARFDSPQLVAARKAGESVGPQKFEKQLLKFMEGLRDRYQAEIDAELGQLEFAAQKTRHAEGKAHFAGRPGMTLSDAAGHPVHVNMDAKPATATRLNRDGTETALKGKELAAFTADLRELETSMRSSRTQGADDLELLKMLAKLQEALRQARG
jgi:hypothetical protein